MKNTLEHSKLGSDINEHLLTLYNLAVGIKAKTIVELGTRTGESMIPLLEAAQAMNGRLYSVDVEDCESAHQKVENFGLKEWWVFTKSDDIAFGKAWPNEIPIDMLFVDTSHFYPHTKKEIEVYEPLVRSGGIIAFHDTVSSPEGVFKPILEFLSKNPRYEFENHPNNNGLGILRKP